MSGDNGGVREKGNLEHGVEAGYAKGHDVIKGSNELK